MGYSRNPKTLESRLSMLDLLVQDQECKWSCDPSEETILAYQIREALWIAANISPKEHPQLAAAYERFEIRISGGDGYVFARRRAGTSKPTTQTEVEEPTLAGRPITIPGTVTLPGIINQVQTYDVTGCPYHFPDANLAKTELISLYEWLEKKGSYLMFWAHPAITIKEREDSLEEFAFQPEDLQ